MKLWSAAVVETRHYRVTYVVEAENAEEARQKMEHGETVEENDERFEGLIERTLMDAPECDGDTLEDSEDLYDEMRDIVRALVEDREACGIDESDDDDPLVLLVRRSRTVLEADNESKKSRKGRESGT